MKKQYLDTDYIIYDDGRCYSNKSKKFLTPSHDKYPTYSLTFNDGAKRKVKIHRMVAETFLPKVDSKNIINHIDGNTKNYNLDNLEWVDYSENSKHAADMQLRPIGNQNPNLFDRNLPNEEWKPIKDYPLYIISSLGRVMNVRTKRILKQANSNYGYYEVNLWKEGSGKTFQIHKMVYSTFYDDYETVGYVINHKDGNKHNNSYENLEKITYRENNPHAEYVIKTHCCAKKIQAIDDNDNMVYEFESINQAQRQLQINNISRAIRKGTRAGGYRWKFV